MTSAQRELVSGAKILYVDLDGTLLGRDGALLRDLHGEPSLDAARALVDAARAGLSVAVMTGRRATDAVDAVRMLGLSGGVAEAGGVLIDDRRRTTLRWGRAPRDDAETPRDALRAAGALDVVLRLGGSALVQVHRWDEGRVGGFLLRGQLDHRAATDALARAGITWAHVLDNGAIGRTEADAPRSYHLLPKGISKVDGVREDLENRGIPAEQAVVIGDSYADAATASQVGAYVSVAGGHLPDPAPANAWRTTAHAGSGVAEVINTILGGHPR